MSTFVSRDFRRGGPKSREEMTSFKNRSGSYSMAMDAAPSECPVIVNTDGEDVRVSPRRNESFIALGIEELLLFLAGFHLR